MLKHALGGIVRHSQAIGKRERMERGARASIKKQRQREMLAKLKRLQSLDGPKNKGYHR